MIKQSHFCTFFGKNGDRMNAEREKKILERLLATKKVTVKELAAELFSSEPSIRRDLIHLESQGYLRRVHGGAILEEQGISASRIPFVIRELEESDAKLVMAKQAISLVRDNDVLFLDASSSAYQLIPCLTLKHNLTVITNGVKALSLLAKYNIKTISTGGEMMASCLSLVGEECHKTLSAYRADIAFFSCRGLSEDGELTDISCEEDYVRQKMFANAKRQYLLCAGNKIGNVYYHRLCHAKDLTGIISDVTLPDGISRYQII